jgi:hypothetical protein
MELRGESLRIFRELHSVKCRCGNPKYQKHAFCRACYFKLPAAVRDGLYKPFCEGYQAAYEDAVQILEEKSVENTPDSEEATQARPVWGPDDFAW